MMIQRLYGFSPGWRSYTTPRQSEVRRLCEVCREAISRGFWQCQPLDQIASDFLTDMGKFQNILAALSLFDSSDYCDDALRFALARKMGVCFHSSRDSRDIFATFAPCLGVAAGEDGYFVVKIEQLVSSDVEKGKRHLYVILDCVTWGVD